MVHILVTESGESTIDGSTATDEARLAALLTVMLGTSNFRLRREQVDLNTEKIHVTKVPGHKGALDEEVEALVACEGGENPVLELWRQLEGQDLANLPDQDVVFLSAFAEAALREGERHVHAMERARGFLLRVPPQPAPAAPVGF